MNKKQEYREFIIELSKLFKPKVYVEIGARFGYVFNAVSPNCGEAYALDLRLKGIKQKSNVKCYQMSSDDFALHWEKKIKKPIDILFIDADHNYKQVIKDFDNFSKFVPENTGLILLHDTYPVNKELLKEDACSDAWKAAKEINRKRKYKDYEIVTLPGPWAGLSIIRKAKRHGYMEEVK